MTNVAIRKYTFDPREPININRLMDNPGKIPKFAEDYVE